MVSVSSNTTTNAFPGWSIMKTGSPAPVVRTPSVIWKSGAFSLYSLKKSWDDLLTLIAEGMTAMNENSSDSTTI